MRAEGGRPRLLAIGSVPRWSGDGKWVYFSRGRIFKISPSGGEPIQVTDSLASTVEESPDGRFLYVSNSPNIAPTPLRRIRISGGAEELILPEVSGRNFIPVQSGIWYLTPNTSEGCRLEFFDFTTKSSRTVVRISRPAAPGLTLSPDRRRIVWSQVDREGADLMLVEKFY
jgi:hypothetical protein